MATFLLMATLATVVVAQEVTEVPEECKDSNYCEVLPPDYPLDAIDKLIEENKSLFRLDSQHDDDEVGRQGPEENMELCKSTKKIVTPMQARGIDDRWYTVVNRKDNPAQTFHVEVCAQAGSSCDPIIKFNSGYSGHCVQKYIQRSVSVMNRGSDGELSVRQQPVSFPSCCACVGVQA